MKLIIFDIDGTLTRIQPIESASFKRAFHEVIGIDISYQKWGDLKHVTDWGIAKEIVAREYDREVEKEELNQLEERFIELLQKDHDEHPELFKEVEGAYDFFHSLKNSAGFEVGIATGSWRDSGKIKLAGFDIAFEEIPYGSSDHFYKRKHIILDAIDQARELYQTEHFDKIVYFGDGVWDLRASQQAGIDFIGIDYRGKGDLKKAGAKKVFENFLKQGEILKSMNGILEW